MKDKMHKFSKWHGGVRMVGIGTHLFFKEWVTIFLLAEDTFGKLTTYKFFFFLIDLHNFVNS